MIDHLICDCDGVLVDSEIIADRVMLETLSATFPGLDFEPVVKTAFGQQTSRFLEGIEKSFDITLPPDFLDTIEHNVELALAASLSPINGVRDALTALSAPVTIAPPPPSPSPSPPPPSPPLPPSLPPLPPALPPNVVRIVRRPYIREAA